MTINERVREVRKTKDLTVEKFGERLGVQKSAISAVENEHRGVSNQLFTAICREFDVSPEWLRDGKGEMFNKSTPDEEIEKYIGQLILNDNNNFKRRFIAALSRINVDEWSLVEKFVLDLVAEKDRKDC